MLSGPPARPGRWYRTPEKRLGRLEAVLRRGGEVEGGLAYGVRDPAGHPGHELREVTQGEGLGMRLPRTLGRRHALEPAARGGHFLIEFREQRASDAHGLRSRLTKAGTPEAGATPRT